MLHSTRWTLGVVGAAALLACGTQNKGTVSLSVKTATTAAAATGGADLGNGIVLTEVRMVVRKIELFPTASATVSAAEAAPDPATLDVEQAEDDGDVPPSSFGPFAVDVQGDALQGGVHPAFDGRVDKGTYAGARIVVNTLPKDFPADPVFSAMQSLHASIAIDGTIDGAAFEFVTPMRVAQRKAGPIQVGDATTNLTLDVDPRGWFTAADGTGRLDPRVTGEDTRGRILENIRCSIRLFKDEDRDGKPDDGDEGEVEGCPAAQPPATPPM